MYVLRGIWSWSHACVVGATATFGRYPHDVLRGVFDVTSFAMYTVLRVDLQLVSAFGSFDVLVNTGRAVTRLGPIVGRKVDADRHSAVFKGQVRRLVLFMVGVADEHAGELVKADDAIGLGVGDGLGLRSGRETGVVCLVVVQGPRRCADTDFG